MISERRFTSALMAVLCAVVMLAAGVPGQAIAAVRVTPVAAHGVGALHVLQAAGDPNIVTVYLEMPDNWDASQVQGWMDELNGAHFEYRYLPNPC